MVMFHLDWLEILGPVVGILLPLLVGIITKASTTSAIKAILLAVLALVTNLVTGIFDALSTHTQYDLGAALILALGTFIVSVAAHFGFFQPTGITADLQNKVGPTDQVAPPASPAPEVIPPTV